MDRIKNILASHLPEKIIDIKPVGGGSINETFKISTEKRAYFTKVNSATKFPQLFIKEKNGLESIKRTGTVKTPEIIACFESQGYQLLVMEWMNEGDRNSIFWQNFGEQLAALHSVSDNNFGYHEDNYMGSVHQNNSCSNNWIPFFWNQRLKPLVDQCFTLKLLDSQNLKHFDNLYQQLPSLFDPGQKPALLHGDLWSGNFLCSNAEPCLIDPAVYFGHPSMDMAMTTLFGGFHSSFYESYQYYLPFPSNYKWQWQICNLYPLLIHLFLFGKSYKAQIENIVRQF